MPKSEDKYVEKVFNWTELHFSEVTSFKIGTLVEFLSNSVTLFYLAAFLKYHLQFNNVDRILDNRAAEN